MFTGLLLYATLMEYCLLQGVTDDGLVFGLVRPDKMMELQKTSGKYRDLSDPQRLFVP